MTDPAFGFMPYALHLALAIAVTIHALLNNRDQGSTVAWIGLAWLSPYVGSVLYFLLGINRVRRRAKSLRCSRRIPAKEAGGHGRLQGSVLEALDRAGQGITQRVAQLGNRVTVLCNGDTAYPEMIRGIDAASRSVGLSTYIFRADSVGQEFIDALHRAAVRGVDVRVLIDGVGGGYFLSTAFRKLRRAGVPAARFMHSALPWRRSFLNLRCHKKILVVDGTIGFAGGLNIGAENCTSTHSRHPVLDTHFMFEGPVVSQLTEVFADDWLFATAHELAGEAWYPAPTAVGVSPARVVNSGPDEDIEKIEFVILEAIALSQNSIKVMTPYFLPDARILTALMLASYRGVDVDLVIPARSNHPAVDWASRAQLAPLLAAGCRVWTHPLPLDHSKLMSVDGIWCFVGSANWDTRSFRLNFETNVEVYDDSVVRTVNELIARRQVTRMTEEVLRERSSLAVIRDSAARLISPYL